MTLEELYMVSQVVAAFAVVASLIFVGLQMRQSVSTQQSLMRQARTDRHVQMGLTLMDPAHMEMYKKMEEGPRQLSEREVDYLAALTRVHMLNSEDIVWQCNKGLLDKSVLEDQKRIIANMLRLPAHRAIWGLSKQRFGSDFIAFVDEIERDVPLNATREDRAKLYLQILDQIESNAGAQLDA